MKRNMASSMDDDSKEILRFIIIVIVIVAVVGLIYLISYFSSKKNEYHYDEVKTGEINSDIVTVGTMFNKKDSEYYVSIYNDEDHANNIAYEVIINNYKNSTNRLNVYHCNLDNKLNENYIATDGKSNPKAKTIADLKLGDFTLVKIKDGKIVKYLETVEDVEKELKTSES